MPPTVDTHRDSRSLRFTLHGLLIAAFVTGGSSQISGWDDSVVQLLALPILAWGLWRLPALPRSTIHTFALAIAALIALVPLVQLLPLAETLWVAPEARRGLALDLAAVGAVPRLTWSLDPRATERAFLFLLPPFALFVAALGAGHETHRQLLRTIMLLALFSLALAFLQLGVPAQSVLNPFPQWASQFNGIFANQNHQGISLVVGVTIALAGMLSVLSKGDNDRAQRWSAWALGFAALFALCALPLTQSRGSVLIGTFAVALVPLALGLFDRRHLQGGWGSRLGLAACLGVVALGVWATVGWMQVDMVDELRKPMRDATAALGDRHAPWGSGVGQFVDVFEQGGPAALLLERYVNHAHSEYPQWWLEAGWLGAAVAFLAILFAGAVVFQALRTRSVHRAGAVAAAIGLAALLAHSWVDYPLRTGTLAAVAGVLCAVLVTVAGRRQRAGTEMRAGGAMA